jgi:hypothetical protein
MTCVVIAGDGDPCPRCGRPMQIREHRGVGSEQLRKRYYYRRWFCCMHGDCRTTIVHDRQFRAFNDLEGAARERRMQAVRGQLRPRE